MRAVFNFLYYNLEGGSITRVRGTESGRRLLQRGGGGLGGGWGVLMNLLLALVRLLTTHPFETEHGRGAGEVSDLFVDRRQRMLR